ncbi:nuclease-related domain-containing protein [Streptomyces sp. NPDC047981]|uniref:nuclease-related domain-containing protein n=1 Tax=Streptomyces sp. NPDC047981 TaxID=3154610 RepID=UPI003423FC92
MTDKSLEARLRIAQQHAHTADAERAEAVARLHEAQAALERANARAARVHAEAVNVQAAVAEVRRLSTVTIEASLRVQAVEQARDTLAVIDRCLAGEATPGDGAWGSVWLHGNWKWLTSQMSTPGRGVGAGRAGRAALVAGGRPVSGRAGGSAAARAAELRGGARRGLWRRLLALLGFQSAGGRMEAEAGRWDIGAAAEQETGRLLAGLEAAGWHVRHDLALPGSRANLDHVLVSPCGTAVVVLDTKRWHRGRTTQLLGGRVHCGGEDRHGQIEAVASYARRAAAALGMPDGSVWPLLVVHGSPIVGGRLQARAPQWDGVVHVLGPGWLVPTLAAAPRQRDPQRAAALVGHVDRVLRAYG